MLALLRPVGKWLSQAVRHTLPPLAVVPSPSLPLTLAEADLPAAIRACPVALKYYRLLHDLDWAHFPERDPHRAWSGPTPDHPRAAYVAAFLVKLDQQHRYFSNLRAYLVEHPALACLLGFTPTKPLPSRKHLGRVLRALPNDSLQFLLDATVSRIADALPRQSPPWLTQPIWNQRVAPRLWLAGDTQDTPGLDGAMVSGRRAAEGIIAERAS